MHAPVLRYLVEVARYGSVRKAGVALNVSSSGINQRILQLERELGVQLFDRSPHGMEPTSAGRLLVKHATQTLSDFDNLRPLIGDLRRLRSGHVEVACPEFLSGSLVPDVLARFAKAHPKTTLTVLQTLPDQVVRAVEDGAVEMGVTYRKYERETVRRICTLSLTLGVIASPDYRFATRRPLTIAEALDQPVVSYCSVGRELSIIDLAGERGRALPRISCQTNSLEVAQAFIRTGRAVAIDTSVAHWPAVEQGALVFLPLEEPALAEELALFIPANRTIDAIEHKMTQTIEAVLADFGERVRRAVA